jgi:hypothetical protein
VNGEFFKYPSTPHLAVLGDVDIRGDKVMSEAERNEFLRHELTAEEKVDGANLGLSFDREGNLRVQNRGAYLQLPAAGQWKGLGEWLASRTDRFFDHLTGQYILFGEWCYARHSVSYDRLPDWFLGFDVYDKQASRFLACVPRNELFAKMQIARVPIVGRGHYSLADLTKLLSRSRLSGQLAEGLYLRRDQGDWLLQRAKLVRPAFMQGLEQHWSRSAIRPNHLISEGR